MQVAIAITENPSAATPITNPVRPKAQTLSQWAKDHKSSLSPWEQQRIDGAIKNLKVSSSNVSFDDMEVLCCVLHEEAKKMFGGKEQTDIFDVLQNYRRNSRSDSPEDQRELATKALVSKFDEVLSRIAKQQEIEEEAKKIKLNNTNLNLSNFNINTLSKLFITIKAKFQSEVKEEDKLTIEALTRLFNDSKNIKGILKQILHNWLENQATTSIKHIKLNTSKFTSISKSDGYLAKIFVDNRTGKLNFSATYNHFKNGKTYFLEAHRTMIINELWGLFIHYNGNLPFDASALFTQDEANAQDNNATEKEKFSTVAYDLKEYASLPKTGISKYLERKGFAPNSIPLDDTNIHYGKGFIITPIWSVCPYTNARSIVGVQRIFDENFPDGNNKVFSSGLKKRGNCIWLGHKREIKSTEKRRVFIVEGLATGLSILLAFPDDLIAVALDANNLLPVAENVRKIFGTKSKCEIIFCADNDLWKVDQINPVTNRPLGNTGLIRANEAALKVRGKVATPDFSNVSTVSKPTDFNDLMALTSIEEVRRQVNLAAKPDPNTAFYHSRFEDLRRSRDLFAAHERVITNSRYLLPKDPAAKAIELEKLAKLLKLYSVVFIKAPIGSGKTELVKELKESVFAGMSILCSTHLISLVANIAQRLGIENYAEYVSKNDYELLKQLPQLAICLNSLPKLLNDNGGFRTYEVIVLDEIEQFAKRLLSHIPNKRIIMMILKTLIQKAKHVILLDAHLGKVTKNLLERWRPNEKFLCLLNEFKVGEGREAIFYDSNDHLIKTALEKLQSGERVFLAFNSRRKAREAFKLFKKTTGKNGLYVSGVNNGDKQVLRFFENVNEESKKYDFVIVTPAVCTGISIDHNHFTFVGGSFNHRPTTPQDALQAIGRIRRAKTLHLFVSDAHNHHSTDEKIIASQWLETHKFDLELANITSAGKFEIEDRDYNQLKLDVTIEQNHACNDFLARFMRLLDADGYTISYQTSTLEEQFEAKFIGDIAKELEEEEFKHMRGEAKDLTDEEEEKLEKRSKRTFEETAELDRKKLKDFYHLPEDAPKELVEKHVEIDNRGKTRKKISNLELALSSNDQLLDRREKELEEVNFIADQKKLFATRELYRQVLTIAGVNLQTLQPTGVIYNSTNGVLEPLQNFLLAKQDALAGLINIRHIKDNPVKLVGIILNKMGIKHQLVSKSHKNREYVIKISTLEEMKDHLLKRGTLPNNQNVGAGVDKTKIPESLTDIVEALKKSLENQPGGTCPIYIYNRVVPPAEKTCAPSDSKTESSAPNNPNPERSQN